MPASSYVASNSLNAWVRGTPPASFPTNVFVGLFITNPGTAGTGTEVSGNGYARVMATFGAPSSGSSGMQVQNSAAITFPTATGSWGTPQYFAIYDASTGGNMLFFGTLPTVSAITTGMTPAFAAGALTLTAS